MDFVEEATYPEQQFIENVEKLVAAQVQACNICPNGGAYSRWCQSPALEMTEDFGHREEATYDAIAHGVRGQLYPTPQLGARRWERLQKIVRRSTSFESSDSEKQSKLVDISSQAYFLCAAVSAIDHDDVDALRKALIRCRDVVPFHELLVPEQRCSLLYYAVTGDHPAAVETLVEYAGEQLVLHSHSFNPKTSTAETCLHAAVALGCERSVRAILGCLAPEAGTEWLLAETAVTDEGTTRRLAVSALHLAAIYGHVHLINFLIIDQKVPIDLPCSSMATALLLAARRNRPEAVHRLLALGAQREVVDQANMTFLHYGILSGDKEMMSLCLQQSLRPKCVDLWRLSNPLLLVAYMDREDIMTFLLDDDDIRRMVDIPTRNFGHTPLHLASSRGKVSASAMCRLLLSAGASVDTSNKQGETPFMTAVSNHQVACMIAMAQHFCSPRARYFRCVSTSGLSIWDYAFKATDPDLLIALLEIARYCYRQDYGKAEATMETDNLGLFISLEMNSCLTSPLHLAVKGGNARDLSIMLKYMSCETVDAKGDTFLHEAARQGSLDIVRQFVLDSATANRTNAEGESLLQVACRARQWACARVLLPLSAQWLVNNRGQTALHHLCMTDEIDYGLLKDCIMKSTDYIAQKLILQDESGQTALHLLAGHDLQMDAESYFRLFVTSDATQSPCNIANDDGDTPIHVALAARRICNFLALLSVFGSQVDINSINHCHMTPLHLAADLGLKEAIGPLLACGADVRLLDKTGNTAIHMIIRRAAEEPTKAAEYQAVLTELLQHACTQRIAQSSFIERSDTVENEGSYELQTAIELLRKIENSDGMTAIFYAVQVGSEEMLKFMLTINDVFCRDALSNCKAPSGHAFYDVTDLVPQTIASDSSDLGPAFGEGFTLSHVPNGGSGVPVDGGANKHDKKNGGRFQPQKRRMKSLVKFILEDAPARVHLLDLTPIGEISGRYWSTYKLIYLLLMLLHVIFMAFFSWSGLDSLQESAGLLNCSATPTKDVMVSNHKRTTTLAVAMVWPVLKIIFDIAWLFDYIGMNCGRRILSETKKQVVNLFDAQVPMFWLMGVSYSWLSVCFFILNYIGDCHQDYVLCMALITGWIFTIHFTQGIHSVHHFALALSRILMRDIWQFGIVCITVLLGYSLGMHALTYAIPKLANTYVGVDSTLFKVFSWGAGMGDFYDVSTNDFSSNGKSKDFTQSVFVTFVIALNIILLNMLIAMMNDSYAIVREQSDKSWFLGSLQRALSLEAQYPRIAMLAQKWRRRDMTFDPALPSRFYLKLPLARMASAADRKEPNMALLLQQMTSLEKTIAGLSSAVSRHQLTFLLDQQNALVAKNLLAKTSNERQARPA